MNNNTYEQDRKECFAQFKQLDGLKQQILHRTAATELIDRGFKEIGSSDVSTILFSMWKNNNKNWKVAYAVMLENLTLAI